MTERDRSDLPEGAALLRDLLGQVERRVGVAQVDELWIFPVRRLRGVDSALVVVSAFENGEERRRIITARTVPAAAAKPEGGGRAGSPATEARLELAEQGVAPADRIGRLLDGVLRRLDDQLTEQPPRTYEVGGDPERWSEVLDEHGAASRPDLHAAAEPRPASPTGGE